tara:strand:- start:195 stop:1766 length:1572 start_codon:yes stop_codon:yes gene_type:complete
MERVAPRQIMYENQLPLAIESKSQRRLFFPEGGSTYGPTGGGTNPNIIRIPINADSLLDVQHSYLQFKLNNLNVGGLAPDHGVPMIRRLRIESAGTTLEDIDNYNKLYAGVLVPSQSSAGALQESTITTAGQGDSEGVGLTSTLTAFTAAAAITHAAVNNPASADVAVLGTFGNAIGTAVTAAVNTALAGDIKTKLDARTVGTAVNAGGFSGVGISTTTAKMARNTSVTYNVPLVSALFNMEKYLPLVMMNAGLTIEIELDTAQAIGVCRNGSDAAGAGNVAPSWTVSDVRYVAHLIDLQRDFYDRMRMVMEGSGGVLQLAGTTYRHYSGQTSDNAAETNVNIPSRIKSIKSVFFTQSKTADITALTSMSTSNSVANGISEYQFRVGSVVYPPTSIKVSPTNKGEAYSELRKAWGNLGAYDGQSVLLNNSSYLTSFVDGGVASQPAGVGAVSQFNPFALDFESFQKIAAENGINTADRSLPMSLELKHANGTGSQSQAAVVDVFVMCDAIFYVNLDGSVSVSI